MDFVAIDFETANEKRSSACAIGIAVVSEGELVESKSWLIRPPQSYFNPFNVSIHGIGEADVAEAPRFDELWPTILPYLEGKTVIAHNAGFDISILKHTLDHYGIVCPELRYSCTLVIARRVWPGMAKYGLSSLADRFGIIFNHHDAEEDAVACARIALCACQHADSAGLHDLMKRLKINRGSLSACGYRAVRQNGKAVLQR